MSAAAAVRGAPAADERASLQDWIAVLAGSLGALIASLDISIVNSALPQIQGEIGASGTEGTWIATGYLVSEVVMIPLTAWLTRVLGLRTLLLSCTVAFTAFSMMCGTAHDLPSMIMGRVGQGFFGGALIPTAQTIVRTRLPPSQMPIGMSAFGLIVLLGPIAGPVVGGWLTENISWQWCFFLNLPITIGLAALLLLGLPPARINLDRLREADWLGIIGMTLGVSCLTVVLEEGQRELWFESRMIVALTIASVAGFIALAVAQFTAKAPVIKLRLMANASYASVIVLVVAVSIALYCVLYVMPQFLSGVSGYNAFQSGQVLFISGVPAFAMMPFLPLMLKRVNARVCVAIGLTLFIVSCLLDTHLTAESGGGDFTVSQILRGFGQIFSFMPLNQASVGSVSREDAPDAAGLFSMARNLGGSIGLALLGVFIDRRVAAHTGELQASVDANSSLVQDRMAAQAQSMAVANGGDLVHGQMQAISRLAATIARQAMVMTYSDCFWVLAIGMIAIAPLVFVLRAPRVGTPVEAAH